jgi:Flp pilus assembly pilin Flp
LSRFAGDEAGATAIEYCLIAGLIFLVLVAGVEHYANSQKDQYTGISQAINAAAK